MSKSKKNKIVGPLFINPESWTCESATDATKEQIEQSYKDYENFPLYWGEISSFTVSKVWKLTYSEIKKIFKEINKK